MKKIALVIMIVLTNWGCLTLSWNYKQGTQAEMNKKWEEAIQYYEKASLEYPNEPVYRLALIRSRLAASQFHLELARRLVAQGKREEAKGEYAKALSFNPSDSSIVLEARTQTADKPKEAETKREKLEFPIKLKAKDEKLQLRIGPETGLRSIFLTLAKSAGINIMFDANFKDIPFTADLTDMSFEEALRHICTATKNFYRIIDERTVIVVPDTPQTRMQYEPNVIRTFYLSNIKAETLVNSLMMMLRSQAQMRISAVSFDKDLNSITIRDAQAVELADKLIRLWDKPKGEVLIDLEIMEVSRTKLRQLGVSFDQNIVGIGYGQAPADSTTASWFNLPSIDLSKAGNYWLNFPISFAQLLESDTHTKIVAQPRLRGLSDEEISNKVGQKIPMPLTQFSTFAAGGVNNVPITSYQQQDVGIEIKIKPRVHLEREVTLELEIKVTSVGGAGYAGIPIINNREIKNIMRLKDGETNLIAGLLRDEERKTLKGIPGLKDLPVVGRLFGAEDTTLEQTDVVLTITPHVVRTVPLGPEDYKALWVDVETVSAERAGQAGGEELLDREINPDQAMRALQQRVGQEGGGSQVSLLPANYEGPANRAFNVAVNVRSDQEVGNMSLTISFDPKLISLKDVREGGLTRQLGDKVPFMKNFDNASGICTLGFSSPQLGRGMKGGGMLATLVFEGKSAGEGFISVSNTSAMSVSGQLVSFQGSQTRIVIR